MVAIHPDSAPDTRAVRGLGMWVRVKTSSIIHSFVGQIYLPFVVVGLVVGIGVLPFGSWTMAWPTCVIVWGVGLFVLLLVSCWYFVASLLRRA